MPRAVVVWEGLEAYRAVLAQFPEMLTGEAANLVEGEANGVAVEIKAAYPVRTGTLRDKVSVTHIPPGGRLRAAAVIKNTAKQAAVFERGSQARHTAIGANRGAMPPGRVFIPRVVKRRRRLTDLLMDLVRRQGATQVVDAG